LRLSFRFSAGGGPAFGGKISQAEERFSAFFIVLTKRMRMRMRIRIKISTLFLPFRLQTSDF
jgi:hypothetical protein